jgi:excisionase family DNA binding protein
MAKPRTQTIEIPIPDQPRLLPLAVPPEEAAPLISVSRSTFYELLSDGLIKAVPVGKRKRIVAITELQRYLAENAENAATGHEVLRVALAEALDALQRSPANWHEIYTRLLPLTRYPKSDQLECA